MTNIEATGGIGMLPVCIADPSTFPVARVGCKFSQLRNSQLEFAAARAFPELQ